MRQLLALLMQNQSRDLCRTWFRSCVGCGGSTAACETIGQLQALLMRSCGQNPRSPRFRSCVGCGGGPVASDTMGQLRGLLMPSLLLHCPPASTDALTLRSPDLPLHSPCPDRTTSTDSGHLQARGQRHLRPRCLEGARNRRHPFTKRECRAKGPMASCASD